MTALTPRDYQVKAVRGVWRELYVNNRRSCLLQGPTGCGKGVMLSFLAGKLLEHRKENMLVLVHRREIVKQLAKHFRDAGVSCGTIMSGDLYTPSRDIQVASVDTLDAWVKSDKIPAPDVGTICIDEAHRAMGMRYQNIIKYYMERGSKLLGTTATPIRNDGVGLSPTFEAMVRTPDMGWMIQHGYLVPVTYRVGIVPDLKGVKLTAGDYNQAQLENVMKQKLLIGNVVDNWLLHAKGRPTMVFASGVEHSMALVEEFKAKGVKAAHVDAHTPTEVRDNIAYQMLLGNIEVVCNAAVYVEGTDIPWVSCVVLAQPTKSIGKYLQMVGRGMRPYSNKVNLMVLDHAGAQHAHGRAEKDHDWVLTKGKEMVEKFASELKKEKVQFVCPACGTLHTGAQCPNCLKAVVFTGAARDYLPATLVDLDQGSFDALMAPKPKPKKKTEFSMADKQDFYAQVLGHAAARSKKLGWVSHVYREKFGVWPRDMAQIKSKPPGDEVRRFIQRHNMAYAKSRANEKAA